MQCAHIVTGVVVVLLALLVGGIAISIVLHCKYTYITKASELPEKTLVSYKDLEGFSFQTTPTLHPIHRDTQGTWDGEAEAFGFR